MKFYLFLVIIFICVQSLLYTESNPSKNVLILNSYHNGYRWTDEVSDSVKNSLQKDSRVKDLYIEYIDWKRNGKNELIDLLIPLYSYKYNKINIDVILTTDDMALEFALKQREKLFSDAPIVFSGVSKSNAKKITQNYSRVSGVYEEADPDGTLKMALRDIPFLKRIFIIHDKTETSMGIAKDIEQFFKNSPRDKEIEREYLGDYTFEELKNMVSTFPENSVIFLPSYAVDKGGLKLTPEEFARILSKTSSVPIYGMYDHMLGSGILGGSLLSGKIQGNMAAKIVLRLFDGVDIKMITPMETKSVFEGYDYLQMKRFGLDLKHHTKNPVIINKPFSFFDTYRVLVTTSGIIFSLLLAASLILIASIRRRTNAESELKKSNDRLAESKSELNRRVEEIIESRKELEFSREKYRLVAEAARDVIWEWDLFSDVRVYPKKLYDMLGYNEKALSRTSLWNTIIHPEDLKSVNETINNYLEGKTDFYSHDYRIRKANGEYIWIQGTGKVLRNTEGKATHFFGAITDITELKTNQERVGNLAYFDSLTGLANRVKLNEEIDKIINENRNKNEEYLLIFIDMDNFKYINDSFGHLTGDIILMESGTRISKFVSNPGIAARFGGDEFVLFIKCKESELEEKIKNLQAVFYRPFLIQGRPFYISISIGAVLYPRDGNNFVELIKNADTAMYSSKESGKGRFSIFKPSMDMQVINHIDLQNKVKDALENKRFFLYYQPHIDLVDGQLKSFEVFSRCKNSDGSFLPPESFISSSEQSGFIVPLGKVILRESFKKIYEFNKDLKKKIIFSINISIVQLTYSGFVDELLSILEENNVEPGLVELEISEFILVEYFESILNRFKMLKEKGFRLAIDNFGTGHSSLIYLRQLPFDTIKIDRSLIAEIINLDEEYLIVNAIINLAKNMWIDVIAVGVENEIQKEYLIRHGCNNIQGYIISKPSPMDEMDKELINKLKE